MQTSVCFLVLLGAFDLLKGLDGEEAALRWAVAGLLVWGRSAFHVQHERLRLRSAIWIIPALALGVFALAVAAAFAAAPHAGVATTLAQGGDLLAWSSGPLQFRDELSWIPLGVGLASALALLVGGYVIFRPLAAPRALPDPAVRHAASQLVQLHGTDTLAFFKLRRDARYLFSPDRRALIGYRVESGVLLVSGDPVGPADALPDLVREVVRLADLHGLELAALGASRTLVPLWQEAGLRALYIGDEAVVDTAGFSLEGRAIRKVRQSVSRLEKAGYAVELAEVDSLDGSALEELERVSERWRGRMPERGFTMAMDELRGGVVVMARDSSGAVRGFLRFVPSFGRPALSLSAMRRDRAAPNGLTEFLVARSVELVRERGFEELSLNFAAFARLIYEPTNGAQRLLGRAIALGNAYFQIESLYRCNAKFFPRWEPRYLVYTRARRLPRVGLAALWIEGQLPKPALRRAAQTL